MSNNFPAGLIVSVSGIRGLIGQNLFPSEACRFAVALGTYLQGGLILVSRDSRPSGDMLLQAVVAGLRSTGCRVIDIGIASTPTCGLAVRHFNAMGAIQITASHNPSPWNGLKMFDADGAVLSPEQGREVRQLFETGNARYASWDKIGSYESSREPLALHAQTVLKLVDLDLIHSAHFRVLVDANGGAGGELARLLLQQLRCEIIEIGCEPNGHFAHEPEPIPAHLGEIGPQVPSSKAALGFVLDPDADRLALIDERGQCVSEEATLALAVRHRLMQKAGPVVINMSTSKMNEDLAKQFGQICYRSAVGEANVVNGIRKHQAVIGGEGNGGVIDPRVGWVRDPYVGMAFILEYLAKTGQTLSQAVDSLPKYAMLKTKYAVVPEKLQAALTALESRWPEARVDKLDGLRLDWPDRWLHVRPSNTEPVVRAIAEAPTAEQAEQLCRDAAKSLGK
ncbi:phosphoglucosamine mutase [Telmatocola sphagniphila]|uniref:Phosphoglucosamine mutase n=1 Tax=Telmatocola sphagniphila TaxID=1123043 RepID=A0A8E6B7F2_9BACT|nr:phosphoglucosamine mutase [Telmatocola sphagniphila]QVL31938.1 phosphoglucosamine mutase [Telmatocola sphagniphila]